MKPEHFFLLFLLLTLNKYMLAGKECFNLGSPILVIKSLLQHRDLEIIWLWLLFAWLVSWPNLLGTKVTRIMHTSSLEFIFEIFLLVTFY